MTPDDFPATHDQVKSRLVIVSNRLPFVVTRDDDGGWSSRPGSGGLVTALAPVLRNRGGLWIGWTGSVPCPEAEAIRLLERASLMAGYQLKPVTLTVEERENFYLGFANEIIWPLFHDFPSRCNFQPRYFQGYRQANQKYARMLMDNLEPGDYVWIHDYHLMSVGEILRHEGIGNRIGFFLHIPFPAMDNFLKLPWRFQILRSLLEYDLIGFQTIRDRRNFVDGARRLIPEARIEGKGQVVSLSYGDHEVRLGAFPIGIDFHEFANLARSAGSTGMARTIREHLSGMRVILGLDRLDYTKGIPERLQAFRLALQRFPEMQEKVVLIQVVVPSRAEIPKYSDLKIEIERLVGEVNGQFTRSGWVPIHYMYRHLDRQELAAYYQTADTALITPLKDGMNLISKEYCACNLRENGALILSEFAGAAAQLQRGAVMVNPHDIEAIALAINQTHHMSPEERRMRMRVLRHAVARHDIYRWVNSFLDGAFARRLDNFPIMDDYLPHFDVA